MGRCLGSWGEPSEESEGTSNVDRLGAVRVAFSLPSLTHPAALRHLPLSARNGVGLRTPVHRWPCDSGTRCPMSSGLPGLIRQPMVTARSAAGTPLIFAAYLWAM